MAELPAPELTRRKALAGLLRRRKDEIMQAWMAVVVRDIGRRDLSPTEFRDSVDDYILAIADTLELDSQTSFTDRGSTAWAAIAREHGVTRVRQGFDIGELVHEFFVLRKVLVEVAQAQNVVRTDVQTDVLSEVIEGAIATSLQSYVASRDYAARRTEAEHIGFLTHELRNPLTTAIVAASQLRERAAAVPELRRSFDLIDRSHRRLKDLVERVLLVEGLGTGTIRLARVEITLEELVRDILTAAEQSSHEKGIVLTESYDPEILLNVDPQLARSAFQNILENAVKYTDAGTVELQVESGPSEITVHVRDNCGGLSTEELRTIFLPFRRGHTKKSGSGLGLAIAREAVQALGGTIEAESTGDAGCHFWFTLPKARH